MRNCCRNFEGSLITENSEEMVLSRTDMAASRPGYSFRISAFSESFYVLCGHIHFSLLMSSFAYRQTFPFKLSFTHSFGWKISVDKTVKFQKSMT